MMTIASFDLFRSTANQTLPYDLLTVMLLLALKLMKINYLAKLKISSPYDSMKIGMNMYVFIIHYLFYIFRLPTVFSSSLQYNIIIPIVQFRFL